MKQKAIYKIPWGIIAGSFAILDFYLILAVVVVKVVSALMIAEAGGDDGLGNSWWIPVVIAVSIIVTILIVFCIVMYILKSRNAKKMQALPKEGK